MNRITSLFNTGQQRLLSVYYTAGFPTLHDTKQIGLLLASAGADLIEIGIPFSDPVADGPTIQSSSKVALDNGMNLKLLLEQTKELRAETGIPIILMGYLNPILQYGIPAFAKDASAAGVDGLIIPDLPISEYLNEYKQIFEQHQLKNIFLISPTTSEERIRQIDLHSDAFIYAVSSSATTGAKTAFTEDQLLYFKKLKSMELKNPIMIGFGISTAEAFDQACEVAQGAIVGSAFINVLAASANLQKDVPSFVTELKRGV